MLLFEFSLDRNLLPILRFTAALKRFFPQIRESQVGGETIAEVVLQAEQLFPGVQSYLLQDDGSLRQHVNIFLNGDRIQDRERLSDPVSERDEVFIIQALSGG